MQTINKVYIVAEKVQTKFTSEVTKQLKKFTLMQKKFTFFEKSLHFLSKKCKKVHITQTSVNLCKLSERFTSICPPMFYVHQGCTAAAAFSLSASASDRI
jgi:hypothetical protein